MSLLSDIRRAFRGFVRVASRPVRRASGRGGVVLQPYRGYGSRERVFLIGRVFRQRSMTPVQGPWDLRRQLRDVLRRMIRRPVRGVCVHGRVLGAEASAETDREGYFRLEWRLAAPAGDDALWHRVALRLEGPTEAEAEAEVYIPPERARFVVISDIDDTVMRTGVANKAVMMWRLFVQGAASRTAFPGVTALYRALHHGASGDQCNPMLYVSRAPWGIYEVLEEFFRLYGIPVGPVLFLREWGISWKSPLPRKAADHKQELIHNMLELYKDLPFVLIGDSGQHDPEIYRQIVEEHPGRVLAVYIRNVSRDPKRISEIEDLATVVSKAGSSLVLAADSVAMAEHASGLGLVARSTVAEVAAEREEQDEPEARTETWEVKHDSPEQTAAAVEEGKLGEVLANGRAGPPPSVVVEPAIPDEPHDAKY